MVHDAGVAVIVVGVRDIDDAAECDERVLDVEAVDRLVAVDLSLQPTSVVKLVFEHGLRLVEVFARGYAAVAEPHGHAERAAAPRVGVVAVPRPHDTQLLRRRRTPRAKPVRSAVRVGRAAVDSAGIARSSEAEASSSRGRRFQDAPSAAVVDDDALERVDGPSRLRSHGADGFGERARLLRHLKHEPERVRAVVARLRCAAPFVGGARRCRTAAARRRRRG